MTLQENLAGLVGARGVRLTLGLAMMPVYARIFRASATYDLWVWVLGIVNATGMLLLGPITETIRASYSAIEHRDGRTEAEQYIATSAVMMISGGGVLAAVLLAAVAALMPQDSSQWQEMTLLLYSLAPSPVLSQVMAVLTARPMVRL